MITEWARPSVFGRDYYGDGTLAPMPPRLESQPSGGTVIRMVSDPSVSVLPSCLVIRNRAWW
jgi:hypothetical protein